MKFLMYKVDTRKSSRKTGRSLNIERFLFLAFIVTFVILIAAQAALMNPSIRTFLTADSEFEGTPLGAEEFLYSEGEIGLELLNAEKNVELKVLVNGEPVEAFNTKNVSIRVKDGDVLEIDGSSVKNDAEVAVVSKSDNINPECMGKRITVQSNIKKIVKVKMN